MLLVPGVGQPTTVERGGRQPTGPSVCHQKAISSESIWTSRQHDERGEWSVGGSPHGQGGPAGMTLI
jgi:hypothetical protein